MPLRPIETREQRQQRLLQSKQARQAREQEIKQGLSSLPGQAAWMGGLMAPSSGITDYLGLYPEPPTGEGITGETMPSFGENIREKRYLDAFYQGLGLTGDLAMGAGTVYPPALALGAGMKVGSGMGKASRAAKAAKKKKGYRPYETDIEDQLRKAFTPEELDRLRGVVAEPKIGAKADELLEWQKPLTEQQPAVQEKIKNLIGEDFFNKAAADGLTGEDVYVNFENAMLRDDLAQYGLEFLEPTLSTEKLGAGAYLNEAGIRGIVYDRGSVEVFDPVKYKKVEPGAKFPESLQPPKKPIGLTNKKITAKSLISRTISPDFYAKEELMGAVGSVVKKNKGEALPPWIYRHKSDAPGGIKDYDEIQELFSEADPSWAAQLDEANNSPTGNADELINKWIRNDDLIPSQVDDVDEWNRLIDEQERTVDLLESKGYTPEGMTEDDVSSAFEKITTDPESVEVEVFVDVDDDGLPPFNRGGPVTNPLYSDKKYLI